jgi:hypothetical protein
MTPGPHRSWIELVARLGYLARGLVFVIVGLFAAMASIGARSRPADSKDALRAVLNQPFGEALLAALAAGLACFAAWRLVQGISNVEHPGFDASTFARRAVQLGAALFYLGFAWIALAMLLGSDGNRSGDQAAREWTAWLLAQPFGRWMVAAIGVVFVVTSVGAVLKAVRGHFERHLDLGEEKRRVVGALGVAGFLARAFVFATIGLFLLFAALNSRSSEAKGIAGALAVIEQQSYGPALLAITAAGLIAFGLYGIAEAAYRRINEA